MVEEGSGTGLWDEGSFAPAPSEPVSGDPLAWPGYGNSLEKARAASGQDESVVTGSARIGGHDIEVASFDFRFLGGSMGEAAGERLARAMDRAASQGVPFVLRTATGGARMQEGMRALVQMPKVVAARISMGDAKSPFIAVLGNPTTGGVFASVASLADYTVAESGATIGFAGPRVVERVTGSAPTGDSHTAESALAHGLVDEVAPPGETRSVVARVLDVLVPADAPEDGAIEGIEVELPVDAWAAVEAARAMDRPRGPDLVHQMADSYV